MEHDVHEKSASVIENDADTADTSVDDIDSIGLKEINTPVISPSPDKERHNIRGEKSKAFRVRIHDLTTKYTELQEKHSELQKKYDDAIKNKNNCDDEGEYDPARIVQTPSQCASAACTAEPNPHMLQCKKCKSLTHYGCTGLPAYQVALFMQKGYRRFKCHTCVGDIPEAIQVNCVGGMPCIAAESKELATTGVQTVPGVLENLDEMSEEQETLLASLHTTRGELSEANAKLTEIEEENKDIKKQLSSQQNNEEVLRELLNEREGDLEEVQSKLIAMEQRSPGDGTKPEDKTKLNEEKAKLEKQLQLKDAELTRVTNEKTKYQKERLQLSQKVATMEKEDASLQIRLKSQGDMIQHLKKKVPLGDAASSKKVASVDAASSTTAKKLDDASTKTDQSSIDQKLEEFSANLLTKVTQIVDNKLNALIPAHGKEKEKVSWADVTREESQPSGDLVSAIRTNKNDELVQEQERQRRINNIIVYGMTEECEDDGVPLKSQDDFFITSLMEILGVDVLPTSIVRLGKIEPGKNRPVKLAMKSADDKEKVMSSLKRLKDADAAYHGLSIRDDYTIEERELIRKFVQDAAKRNETENTTAWKVRGTPKNGLRLVKITRR